MSKIGLSEYKNRKRTDVQLLKAIPGLDLSSVLPFRGEGARDLIASVPTSEYDGLVMKHKAEIGRCEIAKHRIELQPEARLTEKGPDACLLTKRPKQTRICKLC